MFSTPTHKQLDPSKLPAQRVNPIEGSYGRQAMAMIRHGYCTPKA